MYRDKSGAEVYTDEQLEKTLETIGITNNEQLNSEQKQHFRELVCYSWSMFDEHLRPVDSEPVGIQFKDPNQQPIKLQPYRTNAPKLAILKETISDWIKDGIIEPSDSPSIPSNHINLCIQTFHMHSMFARLSLVSSGPAHRLLRSGPSTSPPAFGAKHTVSYIRGNARDHLCQ